MNLVQLVAVTDVQDVLGRVRVDLGRLRDKGAGDNVLAQEVCLGVELGEERAEGGAENRDVGGIHDGRINRHNERYVLEAEYSLLAWECE